MKRSLLALLTAVVVATVGTLAVLGSTERPDPAPSGPERLISLSPAITETLAALDALEPVVGRSDWCQEPPSVRDLPAMGSGMTPHLEAIVRAEPTRVLVDASEANRLDDLRRLAPVEVLPWLTVDEVIASTRRLGSLVGREPAADRLADRLSQTLGQAPGPDAPQVLLALEGEGLEDGQLWYIKRNSLHGAALHAAGARNAVDRDVSGAPVLSLEGLLQIDPPAVVVLTRSPVDEVTRDEIRANWSRMRTLRAVQADRIGVVGGPMVLATGPAILDTVDALRAELGRLGLW